MITTPAADSTHDLGHSRFPQPADVVDDLRPGADGRSRHPRLRRIDRDDGPFGDEGRDDGHDAPALFGFVHRVGSRAGRLTADVHDVGAGIDQLACRGQWLLRATRRRHHPRTNRESR